MTAVIVVLVLVGLLVLGAVLLERGLRRTERMSAEYLRELHRKQGQL